MEWDTRGFWEITKMGDQLAVTLPSATLIEYVQTAGTVETVIGTDGCRSGPTSKRRGAFCHPEPVEG